MEADSSDIVSSQPGFLSRFFSGIGQVSFEMAVGCHTDIVLYLQKKRALFF